MKIPSLIGENKLQQSSIHKAVWVKYDGNDFLSWKILVELMLMNMSMWELFLLPLPSVSGSEWMDIFIVLQLRNEHYLVYMIDKICFHCNSALSFHFGQCLQVWRGEKGGKRNP